MKNTTICIASMLGGVIIGSALAMLFTPQSGPELRHKIKDLIDDEVLELLRDGKISAGHARAILGLKDEEKMLSVAERVVEKELSVRDVERTVRLLNYEPAAVEEEDTALTQRKAYMKDLEHRAVSVLGRRVKILKTAKKKVVELAYSDDDDLEALLKTICGETFFAEND